VPEVNLSETLSSIRDSVEPVIRQILTDGVEAKNTELILYQNSTGGKRIRPALVVLCGQLFGGNLGDLLLPAASIEVLHKSTLILDDIIDCSEFRGGQPTAWKKYGDSFAQCTTFSYLASVFGGLANVKNGSQLADLYSKTLKTIVDGEIKDILFERSGREDEVYAAENRYKSISKDDYFEMVGQKTASLLKACCKAGAISAGANEAQIQTIGDFGYNLGIAFQIRDDLLDIFGNEKEFGKQIGKDIIEKKMGNFVILSALEKLDSGDKQAIIDLLEDTDKITDEKLVDITALLTKSGAKTDAEEAEDSYIQKALESLKKLPQNDNTESLRQLALYVVARDK